MDGDHEQPPLQTKLSGYQTGADYRTKTNSDLSPS